MDIINVFANNVRKYRTKKGLSQEVFAEKAGLHRTYISAIECERRSISLENSFFIIKPNYHKNWHPAIAEMDLADALDQILTSNSGGDIILTQILI